MYKTSIIELIFLLEEPTAKVASVTAKTYNLISGPAQSKCNQAQGNKILRA